MTTTLDLSLQNQAGTILNKWINQYEGVSNSHNGAVLVLDPKTGEILVMLGSRGLLPRRHRRAGEQPAGNELAGVDVQAFRLPDQLRQAGLEPGHDCPGHADRLSGGRRVGVSPQNPVKNSYQGNISLRNALGNSLNVPAFKTAALPASTTW